jgi:hypothetical protein
MTDFNKPNQEWLSLHIFYKYDLDLLLLNVIDPVLCQWYNERLVSNHFFIRYWEGGQHIRLRIKTGVHAMQKLTSELGKAYQDNFLARNHDPAFRIISSDYKLEVERFGGHESFFLKEELFQHSSILVTQILKMHKANWSYSLAVSYALQMHLLFLKAMGLNEPLAVQLLDFLFELYIKYALRSPHVGNLRQEIVKVNGFFESSYLRQAKEINFLCTTIWDQSISNQSDWRAQWSAGLNNMARRFDLLKVMEDLLNIDLENSLCPRRLPKEVLLQWFYLSPYFHLTNNRLGIHLRDESFIYFCLKQGLIAKANKEKDVLHSRSW